MMTLASVRTGVKPGNHTILKKEREKKLQNLFKCIQQPPDFPLGPVGEMNMTCGWNTAAISCSSSHQRCLRTSTDHGTEGKGSGEGASWWNCESKCVSGSRRGSRGLHCWPAHACVQAKYSCKPDHQGVLPSRIFSYTITRFLLGDVPSIAWYYSGVLI